MLFDVKNEIIPPWNFAVVFMIFFYFHFKRCAKVVVQRSVPQSRASNGSGSADLDPAFFVIDLQLKFFLLISFWRYIYINFSKISYKDINKSQNIRNQGFSNCFCLMIEGSGFRSVLLTNGSGSRNLSEEITMKLFFEEVLRIRIRMFLGLLKRLVRNS